MSYQHSGTVTVHDRADPKGQLQHQRVTELIRSGRERAYPDHAIATAILLELLNST